jgi:rhodanese-related sulfurtransferase
MSFLSAIFKSRSVDSDKIEILDTKAYKQAVFGKNVQLVDVRTQREFRSGHIGKAVNIDFFQGGAFDRAFEKFDKQKPIYLYCRSGNRSQRAARKLVALGFEKVYDLKGGILQWE